MQQYIQWQYKIIMEYKQNAQKNILVPRIEPFFLVAAWI